MAEFTIHTVALPVEGGDPGAIERLLEGGRLIDAADRCELRVRPVDRRGARAVRR